MAALLSNFLRKCFRVYKSSKPKNRFYSIFIKIMYRNSHPEVFYKSIVLRNFTKFIGKHLCQSLFFNKIKLRVSGLKLTSWQLELYLKRDSGTVVFL